MHLFRSTTTDSEPQQLLSVSFSHSGGSVCPGRGSPRSTFALLLGSEAAVPPYRIVLGLKRFPSGGSGAGDQHVQYRCVARTAERKARTAVTG